MQAFTYFSFHAFKRLGERTKLRFEDLSRLMDDRAYVHLGNKPGMPREHLLFFSLPDQQAFVAIRDESTGKLVTVLPPDYHENLAWPFTEDQAEAARKLAIAHASRPCPPPERAPKTSFRVSAIYLTEDNRQKATTLFKVPAAPHDWDIRKLVTDRYFVGDVRDAMRRKGLKDRPIIGINVRLGDSGNPVPFCIDELSEAAKA